MHHSRKDFDFSEIVDEDESQAFEDYISGYLVGKMLESAVFRCVVLIAILVSTVIVGVQTNDHLVKKIKIKKLEKSDKYETRKKKKKKRIKKKLKKN
jgi:hypothetical protein